MKKKATYRIRNWSEYNASLKHWGNLKIWISSEAIANWTTDESPLEPGSSPTHAGLAIETYAEGEWKVRQHGVGKRRTWRKLHICVDEATLEIIRICFRTRQERSN